MQRAGPDRHAPLEEPRLDLNQGYVALLGNQLPDEAAMRLDPAGMPVSATRLCDKAIGRRAATQPTINRRNDPVPKVL